MRNKLILIILSIILIFMILGTVSAADINVGPGKTYTNISAAVAASNDGDTINVYDDNGNPKTYQDYVFINKNLTIISKGNVTITPNSAYNNVFHITTFGEGSSIKNFNIKGNGMASGTGIYSFCGDFSPSRITIENNQISGFQWGIQSSYDSESKILKNHIFDNGNGIRLLGGIYTEIRDNIIANNIVGINCDNPYSSGDKNQYLKIIGNTLQNNQMGILLNDSNYNTISGNILESNTNNGITLLSSSFCKLSGNTIKHSSTGIFIEKAWPGFDGNNEIKSSSITDCGTGIEIKGSTYAKVISSSIAYNTIGIIIHGFFVSLSTLTWIPAETNEIFLNAIHHNQNGIMIDDSSNNGVYENDIYNNGNGITVTRLLATSENNHINNNRIAYNTHLGLINYASNLVDAICNWWGSNKSPSNKISLGAINYNPWIVLKIYEGTSSAPYDWRKIIADLTYTSAGYQMDATGPEGGVVPTSILVTFGSDHGIIETPKFINEVSTANSILTMPTSFSGTIYTWIMVDDQFLYLPITVATQQPPQYIGNSFLFNSNFFKIIHVVAIHINNSNNRKNSNQSSGNTGSNSGGTSGNVNTIILAIFAIIVIGGGGYWLFARK